MTRDRTALVTGSSRGIGRAIAVRLAGDGYLVAVHAGHDTARAQHVVAEIRQAGGHACAITCALGRDGDAEDLVRELRAALPDGRLDVLVNNAGGNLGTGAIESTSAADFDRIMALNARAPFLLIQQTLSLMPDGARIVNISSADTRIAIPRELAYSMAKAAVDVLGRTLAHQLGRRGITVNTVAPGITDTDANPWLRDHPKLRAQSAAAAALDRIGTPEDVADVVAFLVSDAARWITGQTLDATGGTFLGPPVLTHPG